MKSTHKPTHIFITTSLMLLITLFTLFYYSKNAHTVNNDVLSSHTSKKYSVIDTIKLGGEWFLNNQNDNFLFYEYYYIQKGHSNKTHELREMASLWAVSKLGSFLNDARYQTLTDKGLSYFEQFFEYDSYNDAYFVNIKDDQNKLGYSAFATLTLLETQHPKRDLYIEKFANGIITLQRESGELQTRLDTQHEPNKDYYPGEALLALMLLNKQKPSDSYVKAVGKAMPFYRSYFTQNPNTAFVPWQTQAYYEYYQVTKDTDAADYIFAMSDYMVRVNLPQNECSQFAFPRGIVTAVFTEGMNKAYLLAKEHGDQKRTDCYANFVKEAVPYIQGLQITEHLDLPAVGGFVGSTNDEVMRVDNAQHAILALIGAYNLGLIK